MNSPWVAFCVWNLSDMTARDATGVGGRLLPVVVSEKVRRVARRSKKGGEHDDNKDDVAR